MSSNYLTCSVKLLYQLFFFCISPQNRLTIAGDRSCFIDTNTNDQFFAPLAPPKAETLVSPSPLLQESLSMSLRNPSTWSSSSYLPAVFQSSAVYGGSSNGGRNNSLYYQENHPPPQSNQRSSSHAFNHGNSINQNILLYVCSRLNVV